MNSATLLDRVAKGSLYAVVFLLPLWFLPITQNILIYQKQALLIILVFLGLIAWLAKAVNQGEIRLRVSILYIPVGLLLLGMGISTLFSKWAAASFWGWPLSLTDSFLTFLAFALFSFLVFQILEDSKHLFRLLLTLLVSSGIAVLYALLQSYEMYLLPAVFSRVPTFNTLGNMNTVAVFAAALLPLALTLAFVSKLLLRWVLWALVLVFLAALIFLNFQTAWVTLTAGLLVLLAFGMWNMRKRAEFGWVSFPMALVIVALFFMVFRVAVPGAPGTIPLEVSPSQGATWGIAQSTLKQNPLFGSGPGTFPLQYAEFRPAELNQTIFFGTRFGTGASEVLNWLVTKGALGLLLLLGLFGTLKVVGARTLLRFEGENFLWMLGLGSFASLAALIVSQFFYPASFMPWLLFWLLLGVLAFAATRKVFQFTVTTYPFLALASSFVFLLVLIFGLGLLFIGGQKYAAEVQYLEGARASAAGDLENAISKVLSAANLNPSVDIYWRDLSQLYLARVNAVAANQELTQEERAQQTQTAVSNAVAAARAATSTAPANVANWNVQGFVYRSLIGIQGAETLAAEAYLKAAELEPNSPFPWTELARAYILQAQTLSSQDKGSEQRALALDNALENLNKALELKDDYAPAHFLTAVVYDQQGKSDEAVAKLEETKLIADPNDIGLAFQLGVLYWQREELSKAKTELERAKSINPNYSNARYILGLVYDAQGNNEAAKLEFSEVERLNPGNEEIKKILANLENGLPALEGIQVAQPPIQETPPEIQGQTSPEEKQ
ncbi:MAG: hypothetical protein Q8P55_01545 [bacterium]|nr:hypothetical protein [bacterium]